MKRQARDRRSFEFVSRDFPCVGAAQLAPKQKGQAFADARPLRKTEKCVLSGCLAAVQAQRGAAAFVQQQRPGQKCALPHNVDPSAIQFMEACAKSLAER